MWYAPIAMLSVEEKAEIMAVAILTVLKVIHYLWMRAKGASPASALRRAKPPGEEPKSGD